MKSNVSHFSLIICWTLLVASAISGQKTKLGPPELALQTGHFGSVLAAAFSPDNKLIATVGDDRNVRLWKTDTGEVIRTLTGHTGAVTSVAFSPDGKLLATGGDDATTRLWDARTGQQARSPVPDPDRNNITAIAFSPNGKLLARAVGNGGSFPAKIRIWNIASDLTLTIAENSEGITQICFSPDSHFILSGGKDGKLKIWDVTSGQLQRQWDAQTSEIAAIAISTDAKTIVTSGRADGTIKVWNFSGELQRTIQGENTEVNCIALANDNKTLLVGNSQVKLFDLNTGDLLRTLTRKTLTSNQVLISPNGELAVNIGVSAEEDAPSSAEVFVWKTATGEFERKLEGFKLGIVAVTTAPDARLISADSDKLITTWDLHKGKIISTLELTEEIKTIVVSPDAKTLTVGGGNFFGPGSIWLFDLTTGQLKHKLAGHLLPVRSVVFSRNGSELLSGGGDGTIKFWDVATGQEKRTIKNGTLPVHVVAFSADEKRVIAASADGKINVWDLATETVVKTVQDQTSGIFSLTFSPDGKSLISAGPNTASLSVWDIATWTLKTSIKNALLSPTAVQFVNNSSVVVSNADGQVQLWNLATGKLVRTLVVHDLGGSSLALIKNRYLVSAAHDGAIHLFDLANKKVLATLYRPRPTEISQVMSSKSGAAGANGAYMAITPRGFYSATEIGESATRLRIGNQVFPAKQIHSTYYRPKIVIAALKQL